MRLQFSLAFVFLTLGGCAGMDAAECRGANWYDVAFRDAILGLQPQNDLYEMQCSRHAVQPDRARYREGWIHGHYEQQQRLGQSVD